MMDRRRFMLLLVALSSVPAMLATAPAAVAKNGSDDGDDGGDDGGDDSGSDGGSSGSGSGGSGSGGGSSGSGGGDDDDSDDDDDSEDDNSGSGSSSSRRDHQRAREAVDQGRILPLREILKRVEDMGGGRVIAVSLDLEARKPFYTLKVQSGASVRTLKLDAASGRRLTLFGW